MSIETVSFARRHVLGDLHGRCNVIDLVPVFLDEDPTTEIGFIDQSLGRYSDAFNFHLPADVCKKLSSGHYRFPLGFDRDKPTEEVKKPRVTLTHVYLKSADPIPRRMG